MTRETVTFDGGINNVVAPHLMNQNEGRYVSNSDISTGELVSARTPRIDTVETYGGKHAIYYRAKDETVASSEDRFYVEWAGFLYWSNSAGVLKRYDGTTINNLGGHTAPTVKPTLALGSAGSGQQDGTYTYAITYLHEEVFESAPIIQDATVAPVKQSVTITFADTPPATATHRKVYRAGGLNPTFNLIGIFPVATASYVDAEGDFTISRKELTTGANDAPPPNLDMLIESNGTLFGAVGTKVHFSKEGQPEYWSDYNYIELPTDVTGLGISGGAVIAFTDDSMFMIQGTNISNISVTKLPHRYGCKHKRTVQNVQGQLIWVSSLDTYDVVCAFDGSSVQILNYSNLKISEAVLDFRPIDDFGDNTYDDFGFNIQSSIVSGRKYYLFLSNRTVVIDLEFGLKTYYMEETIHGAYNKHNQLYTIVESFDGNGVVTGGDVYNYLTSYSQYRNIIYSTKDYSDGELTRVKTYRKLHINASGKWSVTMAVDTKTITRDNPNYGQPGEPERIQFIWDSTMGDSIHMPSGVHGNVITFTIRSEGYVRVKALTYEYEKMNLR